MTSLINPANIDGSYPVAGQDNNSQGFRDNFTNIKVNFQDAAAEITDLQNKAVLKAALTGTTLDNNMGNVALTNALISAFSGAKVNVGGTSGAIAINYQSGHYQAITTSGNITLSFTNWATSGAYGYLKLQIDVTDVAHTVTLPAAVSLGTSGLQGYSAGTITFAAAGTYEFGFGSYDNGAIITIFDLNRALTNFSGADITLSDIVVTGYANIGGNVTGGNIFSGGVSSSAGNVTGANIITGGTVVATANVSGGNLTTAGSVSAAGTVTGSNVVGLVRPSAGSASQPPIKFTSGTSTTSASPGALEYDGVVLYGTPTTGRGVLQAEQFISLVTDYTANDSTSAQKVFNSPTNGAVSLDSNTTYFFEAQYVIAPSINMSATTLSTLFAVTGTLSSIRYLADTTTGLSPGPLSMSRTQVAAVAATPITSAAPGGAATNFTVRLQGMIRTNTAGTLTPQMQFSSTPGSAPIVRANSFFRITPVGNGSVTSVGAWS